jgi:hypothetical protein
MPAGDPVPFDLFPFYPPAPLEDVARWLGVPVKRLADMAGTIEPTPAPPLGSTDIVAVYLDVPTARMLLTALVAESSRNGGHLDGDMSHTVVSALALALSNPVNTEPSES